MASFLIAIGILLIIVIAVIGLIAFDRLIQYQLTSAYLSE